MNIGTEIAPVVTALADFSASNVVTVFTTALGIVVPLVLIWFGLRFVYRKAKGGLKRGA